MIEDSEIGTLEGGISKKINITSRKTIVGLMLCPPRADSFKMACQGVSLEMRMKEALYANRVADMVMIVTAEDIN